MNKKVYRVGLLGAGGKLTIKDGFLEFKHPYARTFRVAVQNIDTVTVDVKSRGSGILKIIGQGTTLAQAKMPIIWANKCQSWILENK